MVRLAADLDRSATQALENHRHVSVQLVAHSCVKTGQGALFLVLKTT